MCQQTYTTYASNNEVCTTYLNVYLTVALDILEKKVGVLQNWLT